MRDAFVLAGHSQSSANRSVIQAGMILRDIPRLSQNEAYACLGLSELSHSDQILRQYGTKTAGQNTVRHCRGEETLSLKNISSWQFNRFLPARNHLRTVIGEEVEWFADGPENSIGTIAFNTKDRGWNYAVLRRDWKGDFQVCDLVANLYSLEAARADFRRAMAVADRTAHSILHQGSD